MIATWLVVWAVFSAPTPPLPWGAWFFALLICAVLDAA